jgi:N-acetylmuramoyl-L-alanine amidase
MRRGPGRVVAVAMLVFIAAGMAPARTIDIGGNRVETRMAGKVECVPLSAVAAALNGKYWRVNDRFVMVLPGDSAQPGREYVLRADSTCALCDSRRVVLPAAPVIDSNRLYLPVVALADLLPSTHVPDLHTMETARQGDTVIFTLRGQCRPGEKFAGYGDSRSSLEYRLLIGARRDSGLGQQVALLSLTPPGILKTVTLDSSAGTSLNFSFRQPATERLTVLPDRVELRVWPRPERAIRRLILDPGHGGVDPGALGRRGTREKVVVMDVARRLKKKLEKQGFEVVMTRDTDKFVSLAERTEQGTVRTSPLPLSPLPWKADLLISIHANASPNRAACGLETYFLSEAKTDWERAVAARENAEIQTGDSGAGLNVGNDVGLILADLAQNEFLVESSELAAQIQEAAVPHARIKDRGVRQANFYVLRNNFMPAVLVECGFLSNKSEEKLLRQLEHRERLAEGISRGIVEFTKLYGPTANGSQPGGKDTKTPRSKS